MLMIMMTAMNVIIMMLLMMFTCSIIVNVAVAVVFAAVAVAASIGCLLLVCWVKYVWHTRIPSRPHVLTPQQPSSNLMQLSKTFIQI